MKKRRADPKIAVRCHLNSYALSARMEKVGATLIIWFRIGDKARGREEENAVKGRGGRGRGRILNLTSRTRITVTSE